MASKAMKKLHGSSTRGRLFLILLAAGALVFVINTISFNSHTLHLYRKASSPPSSQCPDPRLDCSRRVLERNKAEKWIALWVPSDPEVNVSHLTRIPGWKTVVVGDGPCPRGCSYPSCVFLDPSGQAALSEMSALLPPDNPAKKNLAYLYAIKQQATYIYDADIHVRPLGNLTDFFYTNTSGLVYKKKGIFNYYQHYGEHWFYPPGYVELEPGQNDPSEYLLMDVPQPEVQHGLVKVKDGGPRFQSVAPTVFVGSRSMAPYEARNTLYRKNAFWGLLSFPTAHSDSIRSYFLQTLLKYINGFIGFINTNAESKHTVKEPESKIPKGLVAFMLEWNCKQTSNLEDCILQLADDLRSENILTNEGVVLVRKWLTDLKRFGYDVSQLAVRQPVDLVARTNQLDHGEEAASVNFSPSPSVYYNNNHDATTYETVHNICPNFTFPAKVSYQFDDILLVITFNYAFLYDNIEYVEALYRRYFPNILFCGPNNKAFLSAISAIPLNSSVAYVAGIERGWRYFQECTVYAMKMNFGVKGYLQIGEDTLINPWTLRTLSRDSIWFIKRIVKSSRIPGDKTDRWPWWPHTFGKRALEMTFSHIETQAALPVDSFEKRFYNNFIYNADDFQHVYHQTCDFFYIPNRLREEFIYFTGLFFNSTLLVEAALPTMILGLERKENTVKVAGKIMWGPTRDHPERFFNEDEAYAHAFKGRKQLKQENCKRFMCEKYLPTLVRNMDSDLSES